MSCNYVAQPPPEDDQCSGDPEYRVLHRPDAGYWFETCRNHLTNAIDEVMADDGAVVVSRIGG